MKSALFTAIAFASVIATAEPVYLNSGKVLPANLPFSEAVIHGDILYLSGQIPNVPGKLRLVEGGIESQSRQVMENIRTTLNAHGYDMEHLIKCTVMLDEISDWAAFNEVYKTYFDKQFPARSAFATDGLAVGALVEVECIAAIDGATQ